MEESILYKSFRKLATDSGKSFKQIEKDLGYSRKSLSIYKTKTMPSAIRLLELAEYFDVTPRYLLGMDKICSKNHDERDFAEFLFISLDKNLKIEICKFSQTCMS